MTKTAVVCAQQRWEHVSLTRRTASYLVDEANVLGQEGWEMVGVIYAKDPKGQMAWTAFFKRPAAAAPPGAAGPGDAARQAPPPEQAPARAPADKQAPAGELKGFDLDGDEFAFHKEPVEDPKPPSPPEDESE